MEELTNLADLLDLQAVDLDIDRLLEQRQGLPELSGYREADARLKQLEARIAEQEGALTAGSRDLDKEDGELQILEQKMKVEEQRLFAGGLSARETEHMRAEVEMLRRQVGEREERVLELMEQRDDQEKELESTRNTRASVEDEKARLEEIIKAEWRKIDAELARRESRKADIVTLIPEDLLELYEELRPHKEGVAVGRLGEGVCGGCHLKLSAAEQAQVLKEFPPRCLHCRRILVPQ